MHHLLNESETVFEAGKFNASVSFLACELRGDVELL